MLACLQRSQTHATQHLMGGGKIPELQLPIPRKSEMSSAPSPRYPTPAELDAYARKIADSPLSIKIFPTNIRVPQHKQISRTVNGLDTTGQRYSPYAQPYSGGYQGLLAVVRTPTVSGGVSSSSSKGVLKTAEGKRAKLSPAHIAVAPYAPPANSTAASRLRQKAYAVGHCKLPEASTIPGPPNVIMAASVVPVSGGQSLPQLAHQSEIPVQSLLRHMGRPSHATHAQGLQPLGEAQTSSPALQAATATAVVGAAGTGGGTNTTCSDSGFTLAAPPHSGLAYSGAVLPMQSADTATGGQYMDSVDYALWQHKQHKQQQQQAQPQHQQQQQQHYHQGALRMYGANSGGGAVVSRSPETCVPQLAAFRSANGSGSLERVGSSPLHCPAMHGEFSVGQFFAPPWNSVLATPDSDCYNSLELPLGSTMGLPHHPHPHHHHHHHHHHHPSQPHTHSQQHYPADRGSLGLCCGGGGPVGPPSRTLCHASVLSSSLQSLECLISEIHPPCIKERMLGRGYEAVGGSAAIGMVGTRLLDPPPTHIQLPVFR